MARPVRIEMVESEGLGDLIGYYDRDRGDRDQQAPTRKA